MFGKRHIVAGLSILGKPSLSAKIESVQQLALFAGVCPAECAAIISVSHEKRLYRCQNLFSTGDAVDQVFLVLSGTVKMTQTSINGEAILRVCGVGDLVGMFGLWPDEKHNSTAQAADAGAALVWDSATFAELLDQFTRLLHNTFRVLEERLQEMEQRFRELSTDDVPTRLSSELIRLSKRFGCGGTENGEIHLSQTDLAQLTCTTVSTVSRVLGRWEKLGMVSVGREAVQIRNFAALTQLTQSE